MKSERAAKFVYDRCGTVAQRMSSGFNTMMNILWSQYNYYKPVMENFSSPPEG